MNYLYFILLLLPLNLLATETYELVIYEHKFIPEILLIPADKKIKLLVINKDEEAE